MAATKNLSDPEAMPFYLKWGMAFLVFYTVNQLHFPTSLGVPGLNVLNIIFLILLIMHARSGRKGGPKPIMRKRLLLLFGFILYAFLIAQITWPADIMIDVNLAKAAIFYPVYFFFFFYVVRTEDDVRFIMYAVLFTAMLAGLEGLREGLDYGNTSFDPMKRASGPFGDNAFTANRAGIFYAMFICLAIAIVLYHPQPGNRWIRWAAIGAATCIAAGLFYTFSRQSYLIVGAIAPLMLLKRGPALIVIVLIAGLNYQFWVPEAAIDRLTETKQVDEDGVEQVDDSTSSRWDQWEAGWRMIQDKPWGVGLGRFALLSGSYGGRPMLDAHNHYVLFAAEAGPLGIVVHIVVVLSLWWYGHQYYRLAKRRKNPLGRALGSGFAFMSLAMILGNIYGSPFANGEVMGVYWALAGVMARHMAILRRPEKATSPSWSPTASPLADADQTDVDAEDSETPPVAAKNRPRRRGRRHQTPDDHGPMPVGAGSD